MASSSWRVRIRRLVSLSLSSGHQTILQEARPLPLLGAINRALGFFKLLDQPANGRAQRLLAGSIWAVLPPTGRTDPAIRLDQMRVDLDARVGHCAPGFIVDHRNSS